MGIQLYTWILGLGRNIMEYKIVATSNCDELKAHVNLYIKKGWVPQGGIAVVHRTSVREIAYYQAMVRYTDED